MGGLFSRSAAAPPPVQLSSAPTVNLAKTTVSGEYAQQLSNEANEAARSAQKQAGELAAKLAAAASASGWTMFWIKVAGAIFGIVCLALIIIAIYDAVTCQSQNGKQILFYIDGPCNQPKTVTPSGAPATGPANGEEILIISATFGDNANPGEVTSTNANVKTKIESLITGQTTIPAFTVGHAAVGLPSNPATGSNILSVQWRKAIDTVVQTTTAVDGSTFGPISSSGSKENFTTTAVSSPRPILQQWYYGSASGTLIPSMHDTKNTINVASNLALPSSEGTGAYGIQWWMFVKDWNYKYGSEKMVLSRSDSSNSSIYNPKITLAPTENNLKVSVSIFPSELAGASKTEPAPANNYSATDDVFVCEVPNIPLQSWISVSVTVFDRNLDVYINGNLVKSCFLPGVPKPAVGNIDVSKNGGFSGYMCGLNHYGKALVPSDAQAFYAAGTSCANQTGSAGPSGNYNVKFGLYDTKGKEVKEYTF
jgi:hypothetical protein